jgi:hypothetical protein
MDFDQLMKRARAGDPSAFMRSFRYLTQIWDAQSGQPLAEPLQRDVDMAHNYVPLGQLSRDGTRVVMMEQGGTASVRYLTRTVSPFARQTVPEYIEDRIKEDSVQSLDEAARLAVGNDPLLERIAAARAARNERLESDRRILVSLRLTSC